LRGLLRYYTGAIEAGAQVILTTCSSVGEVVEHARPFFDVPLLRIDKAMRRHAVEMGQSVAVLATLPTTLAPTVRLLTRQAASLGMSVAILEGLAKGPYEGLLRKEPDLHDRLILEAAETLATRAEVFVLAQGSMAQMQETLVHRNGKSVLSTPRLAVLALKEAVERMGQ
jgi:Asp/Glu/hydantoin racemase